MFAKIALPIHLNKVFDYRIPEKLQQNIQCYSRVIVPFQNKKAVGLICTLSEIADIDQYKIKAIDSIIDETPLLDEDIIFLCKWANHYYQYPIGEIIFSCLPKKLKQGEAVQFNPTVHYQVQQKLYDIDESYFKRSPKKKELYQKLLKAEISIYNHGHLKSLGFNKAHLQYFTAHEFLLETTQPEKVAAEQSLQLNEAQAQCFDKIKAQLNQFTVFLLEGVTGSGKTEIYLQTIQNVITENKQALVLVPEIALTPQTIARFEKRFPGQTAVLHSSLGHKKKLNEWVAIQSGHAKIIIGTRSALLTPFFNLGVIIIDEEHDPSFKQQEQFRYSSRDLAVVYAKRKNIPVVLGSATPALESLYKALKKHYVHLRLPERANQSALPDIKLIDCRRQILADGLSQQLSTEIQQCLARGEQAMLFINRRGYAPVYMCHACGWAAECERCDTKMTYHRTPEYLQCHFCLKRMQLPRTCPDCEDDSVALVGIGTQRLEAGLKEKFNDYPILRLDRDNAPNDKILNQLFEQIHTGEPMIIIGTQLIAKGHHFPNLSLVGIIDVDSALYSSEFRAVEQMGQLVTQVAGRAGRENKKGLVILQTYHPEDPYLQPLLKHDYHALAAQLLKERHQAALPPFTHFAVIRAEAHTANQVFSFLNTIVLNLPQQEGVDIHGPLPLNKPKRAGYFRGVIIFKGRTRAALQLFLRTLQIDKKEERQVRWHLEVDPMSILN